MYEIIPSYGMLRGIRWFDTDFSTQIGDPGEPLKVKPKGSPETSIPNYRTPCNNSVDGRI
jgi:hypothetical protein